MLPTVVKADIVKHHAIVNARGGRFEVTLDKGAVLVTLERGADRIYLAFDRDTFADFIRGINGACARGALE